MFEVEEIEPKENKTFDKPKSKQKTKYFEGNPFGDDLKLDSKLTNRFNNLKIKHNLK